MFYSFHFMNFIRISFAYLVPWYHFELDQHLVWSYFTHSEILCQWCWICHSFFVHFVIIHIIHFIVFLTLDLFYIFDSLFWCRTVNSNWTYFGLELLLLTARSDIIGAELVDRTFQILLIYLIFFLFPIIRIIISLKYSQSSIAIFLCIT